MNKRTWLAALLAPAILAVALLASNGHPVHLTHAPTTSHTHFLAGSGGGGGGPGVFDADGGDGGPGTAGGGGGGGGISNGTGDSGNDGVSPCIGAFCF